MSVPLLMTVLDAGSTVAPPATAQQVPYADDDQLKTCASYVETAAIAVPKYSTSTANDLDVIETAQLPCALTARKFSVQLNAELEPNELVGLTGDSKALGEWELDRCVALKKAGALEWTANVTLHTTKKINYRYFVYVEDKQGHKQIRRWESQLQPRVSAVCGNNGQQLDRFGEVAVGEPQVNRGWLTSETIVQLKFEREKMFQVSDVEKFDPEHVLLKIVPLSDDLETGRDLMEAEVNIEVTKLKYGESHLQPQQTYGISYRRGDVVIFHLTMVEPQHKVFALVFHTPEQQAIGKTVIRGADLLGSEGELVLPITEPFKEATEVIARLTLPYVVINPFVDAKLDFRATYAHYWPKSWPNLDVGHRGNGKSYLANPPAERENTIASFLKAYEKYADMIELDVHLTADGVPVIYHDFGMRTAPSGKQITSPDQLEYVLIKDVTYVALKKLRVFAVINNQAVEYPSHNAETRPEHRIFPTLLDVLEGLPKTLGIDVEIKWPQRTACGGVEAPQTIDKNYFIDQVLSLIISHGCGRPLIFSSFDADICSMLRFKQNIFPVMFLTQGETKKWSPFLDLRTRTFEQAVNNAQAFELAGTAPHAEDFLGPNGKQLIDMARTLGQIAVVWGDDCNSRDRVDYFNKIGATATCYDRSDLHMPPHKERAFFNSTLLMAEFEGQCRF